MYVCIHFYNNCTFLFYIIKILSKTNGKYTGNTVLPIRFDCGLIYSRIEVSVNYV
jgi:hypothetical protein